MQTSLSDHPATPEEKLHDYQQQLSFVQSELIGDRAKLQAAKAGGADSKTIDGILKDIGMLETAIDQIQANIHSIQQQLR